MMKKVSEGQNPHVVSMVGCVTVQEPLSLISEFVPFGNLLQYLRTNQKMVSCNHLHYTISQASYIHNILYPLNHPYGGGICIYYTYSHART